MIEIKRLTRAEVLHTLDSKSFPPRRDYLAMYSTWLGGITTDVNLMFVPVDDHLVHRGDGVFEAIKCVSGTAYQLQPHLARLARSAAAVEIPLPFSLENIQTVCLETLNCAIEFAGEAAPQSFMLRLYVSRGPGGFTTNPYESIGSQLYVVVTRFKPMADEKYRAGVRVGISQIAVKEGHFAQIKSCNYLANVLMKKEAVDRKLDFTVSVDSSGLVAESSTENFAIITRDGEFLVPKFERTLRGITAVRVMELAAQLVKGGKLKAVKNAGFGVEEVRSAAEAMMLGTTLDVLPVVEFEGARIGNGRPGINTLNLLDLLRHDILQSKVN